MIHLTAFFIFYLSANSLGYSVPHPTSTSEGSTINGFGYLGENIPPEIVSNLKKALDVLAKINGNGLPECIENGTTGANLNTTPPQKSEEIGTYASFDDIDDAYEIERLSPQLGTITGPDGKPTQISIVSESQVQSLFRQMAAQSRIPFRYPEDGCYARAHAMSALMERRGITSGKAFIEGDLRVETTNSPAGSVSWWYHVAPIVLVEKDGEVKPYVIDPSIFDRAVPVEDWYAIQTRHHNQGPSRTYKTVRFAYTPSDSETPGSLNGFRSGDLRRARETLNTYLRVQNGREMVNTP